MYSLYYLTIVTLFGCAILSDWGVVVVSFFFFFFLFVCFFFQAEDGIRYLVRSRGLGDVYKRQPERLAFLYETYLLVQAGMYPHSNLFIVLEHCRHDTDYVIWKMIALVLQSLRLCLGDNHSNLSLIHI